MTLSRFWWSVWSVAKYLLGLSLLIDVLIMVGRLFGLLALFVPRPVLTGVDLVATAVAAIVGTMLYADWQWGWTYEHMGLHRRPGAVLGGFGGGIALGVVAALLTALVQGVSTGAGLNLSFVDPTAAGFTLVRSLVLGLVAEVVFRAAAISRYQADLSQREILLAATLTPVAWMAIQASLWPGVPITGILTGWEFLMSVALALLFIRLDSAWLTAGIRFGMVIGVAVLGLTPAAVAQGGLMVWGAAAAVLLALEWFKQQGQPKRMQPTRGRVVRGRTVRGPWGPH